MLEAFYRDNYPIVYGYLLSLCGDVHTAEDLTAETFLKAIEKIDTYDPRYRATTWLCTIGRNLFINECKRNKKLQSLNASHASAALSPEEQVIQNDRIQTILTAAKKLDELPRQVFFMRLQGMSFREIGLCLGKTENWARVTYFRAKGRILTEMEELS